MYIYIYIRHGRCVVGREQIIVYCSVLCEIVIKFRSHVYNAHILWYTKRTFTKMRIFSAKSVLEAIIHKNTTDSTSCA